MSKIILIISAALAAVTITGVMVFIFAVCCAYPFMLVWNYAVVNAITIAKPIDFWTALLLNLLLVFYTSQPFAQSKKETK